MQGYKVSIRMASAVAMAVTAAVAMPPARPAPVAGDHPPATTTPEADTAPPTQPPEGWSRVTTTAGFILDLPPGLERVVVQGKDSQVERWTSPGLDLHYDQGFYSDALKEAGAPEYRQEEIEQSGHKGRLVTFLNPSSGTDRKRVAAVHFPRLIPAAPGGMHVKLTIWVDYRDVADQEKAKAILKSVAWPPAR